MRGRKYDCSMSPLFPKTGLCSYVHISFLQSESDDNRSIPQPSGSSSSSSIVSDFRHCHSVVPVFYEEQCFCSANSFHNVRKATRDSEKVLELEKVA